MALSLVKRYKKKIMDDFDLGFLGGLMVSGALMLICAIFGVVG